MAPPIAPEKIGKIDIALVSHAQHLDNLDNEGRKLLSKAGVTITTPESAVMNLPTKSVRGLKTWASTEVTNDAGEKLKITAMPAVHTSNPDLRSAVGEVTGFMLEWEGQKDGAFYISGDTVWIDEINEIAKRYKVAAGILHLGAANVPAVGDNFLTMNAVDGVRATKTLGLKNVFQAFRSQIISGHFFTGTQAQPPDPTSTRQRQQQGKDEAQGKAHAGTCSFRG